MSIKHQDRRLRVWEYHEAIEGVQTQFELIRFALKALSETERKRFFKDRSERQIQGVEGFRNMLKEFMDAGSPGEADRICDDMLQHFKRDARRDTRPGKRRFVQEFSEDRLNQSELLLLVAHFESFFKIIHEAFLVAAPNKVFGKKFRGNPKSEIPCVDIFDSDIPYWEPKKFLKELIIKEVKWLDSQKIERRATYFEEYFGISFGKPDELQKLKEIMDLRNQISHNVYETPPRSLDEVKEQPLVSDETLQKARSLFYWIPNKCIEAGAKDFPGQFFGSASLLKS